MEGWTFHGPAAEEGAEAGAGAGAGAGGGGQDQGTKKQRPQADGLWGSLVTRVLGGDGAAAEGGADPHFRGPPATLTAALVNASPTTSTGGGEVLDLSVHLQADGVARLRVTERYGGGSVPRWTADELVLTAEEMVPAADARVVSADSDSDADAELLGRLLASVRPPAPGAAAAPPPCDGCAAVRYGGGSHVLLLLPDPFELHLFRVDASSSSFGDGPVVSVGGRGLAHFEVRRSRDGTSSGGAASDSNSDVFVVDGDDDDLPPSGDDEEEGEEGGEEEDGRSDPDGKHGGKEVVGYWEDGLAIYADGSREERPADADADAEAGSGRRLLSDNGGDALDTDGMWEESFGDHKDSKPYGPMSVGMDVAFPGSSHLYGLPEHASSTLLQATKGEGGRYSEPYRLYNLDVFEYELDETMALYGEVPLVVSQSLSGGTVGAFWFNPSETFVDVYDAEDSPDPGQRQRKGAATHFMSESGVMDLFLLPGPDPASVYAQYGRLTGRAPVPPIFSLGYHQCRWNYRDEADVYAVHAKFEELDYPYDVLWLDIEHTDGKRYFTWDSNTFPHPVEMQKTLSDQGRRMVTIVDPHIKRDDNYYIHKEATAKGLYVKDRIGSKDYDGWCWPGSSSYLDFTSEHVRSWWADQFAYDRYAGSTPSLFTWNDMNEPSVFNGPEVSMQKDLRNLAGVEHREWHNLYGLLFQGATASGLVRRNAGGNVRPFVLSRSFFAGSQKYGAIWTGDNKAEWSHLAAAAPMLLSLNVGALSFVGADVGGFFGDPDAELMTRWMQAGSYQPFFRGHAHHDSKRREPWMFGEETMIRLRKAAIARYALLPFWYTVFYDAWQTGMPVMRTMWMQYPRTEELFPVDDQYLIGSDLLVKPIAAPGVTETSILFPSSDTWYDVDTLQVISAQGKADGVVSMKVASNIDKIPVYQRGGSVIPRKLRLRRSSRLMKSDPYTLYVALDSDQAAEGILYMDDEETFEHERNASFGIAKFVASFEGGDSFIYNKVTLGAGWADQAVGERMLERIVVMGVKKRPKQIQLVGSASIDFEFDATANVAVLKKPGVNVLSDWKLRILY